MAGVTVWPVLRGCLDGIRADVFWSLLPEPHGVTLLHGVDTAVSCAGSGTSGAQTAARPPALYLPWSVADGPLAVWRP